MKTLKKVLSLVLVVAMIASMLIVGAAAAEETKYPEAAAVISAIKVMEGDERGMRYGDTVTREEAAAIICRTILGDAAETLYTASAPFADVAATRWSAKYISYLKAKGIVSGVSDTEFDPTAPVTGIAFAKMLLTAVGYGKGGEFEGAQWDINTISFANTTGLFEGSAGVNVAAAATREQCMLYAFNTITEIPAVNYNASFGAYYVGSNPFSEPQNKDPFTLAATTFNLAPGATTPNEYGRPAATWTVNGMPVVNAVTSVAPVATYTNGTTVGAVYAALGKAVVDSAVITYTENGQDTAAPTLTNAMPGAMAPIGGLGDTVEVYSVYNGNGTYNVYIVVVTEYYGVVKSAVNGVVTLADNVTTINGSLVDISGLAKTDFVLYTKIGNVVKTVKEVTPVSLTYTANKAATAYTPATIVADGATYALRCANPYTASTSFGIPYDLYFDSLGNIVKMQPSTYVATEFNYVYVNRVQAKITTADLIESATNKVAVSVAYPTGSVAVIEPEVYVNPATYAKYILVDGQPVYMTAQQLSGQNTPNDATDDVYETNAQIEARLVAAISTGWHTYTVGTNGGLNFNSIAFARDYAAVVPSLTVAFNSANVGVANKAASPATVLTTVDPYGNATVKTGYASFPQSATYTDALITFAKGSNTIANIYAVNVLGAAPAPALVYCVAVGNNIATGTEYTVVGMDGVAKTVVAPANAMTAKTLYTLTALGDGTYTANAAIPAIYGTAVNNGTAFDQYGLPVAVATVGAVGIDYFTDTGVEDDIFTENVDETVAAIAYYFDAYTTVVDCTGNGATAVSEGDVFVATVNTAAQNSYAGLNYCSTIWIVG